MHLLNFLPGTLLTEQSFSRASDLLRDEGHSVETQILGDGESFDSELTRLADSVKSPRVWVGHSLGGIFALNLAIRHPDKCAAIVCISSTARADAPSNHDKRLAQLHRAQSAGSCEPISLEMKPVFGLTARSPLATSLVRQAESVGLRRFAHQVHYALTRPNRADRCHTINCPILAIVGIDDDICPTDLSDEIIALGALENRNQRARIAGAGHLVPMTHPQQVAARIDEFLATIQPPKTLSFPSKNFAQ